MGIQILSLSAESISLEWAKQTCERYFQHEKIKFVSPSSHVMFCLFYRYWWNSYIEHNFFFIHLRNSKIVQFKVFTYRKMPVTKMLWNLDIKLERRNKDNNTYIFLLQKVKILLKKRKIMLVTMATSISSHVKDKNNIFTLRDEDMIF